MSQNLDPPSAAEILAEEAQALRDRATGSARSVLILIAFIAISLASVRLYVEALLWTSLASAMVGVTVTYARVWSGRDRTVDHTNRYLRGHVIITACTGLLWSAGAMQLASPTSELQTFLAGLFLSSILAGGVSAGTVYRPGYLALAFTTIIPFALYLVITMDGVLRIYGGFMLFYLVFCIETNKSASQKTREALAAKLTSRQAEAALRAFAEAAKQHSATNRSIHAIRHDMAQPLLALRNFLDELDRTASNPAQTVLAHQIRLALVSQEALVCELNHVEAAQPKLEVSDINADEVLSQLESEYAPQLAAIDCVLEVRCSVGKIVTDRLRLERILRNLLSNAVKYAGNGGRVILAAQAGDGGQVWSVQDFGPGLTNAQRAAFEEGRKQYPSARGSGLGLSITHQLARELNGTLKLETERSTGTQTRNSTGTGTKISLFIPQTAPVVGQHRAFLFCIGKEVLPGLGAWIDLSSSWTWEFAHAEACSEASGLIDVLGIAPDLIILDLPGDHRCAPKDIEGLASLAPLVQLQRDPLARVAELVPAQLVLPEDEASLRSALEAELRNHARQNKASSRAR